ncbi:patatin-like protein 2 [Sorghum bicolor]|uniref:patatin-like protein 2 n=1 Tax=Sorghum bicolor TaxID=4558 RepID=UPI000B423D58|nr:patatin-like protein 2 [Sorghum bicolor]|eukprot:XP_021317788.1 patatin-like protein 2 [Sorghum bicolor]
MSKKLWKSSRARLPPPVLGNHITVLSIDGGGIRGLIPLSVLKALEEELQCIGLIVFLILRSPPACFTHRGPICGWLYFAKSIFYGPRYNHRFLHKEIKAIMGHRKLDDTLTNVVIPAFDTRWLKTRIFSSFKSQIGISTNKPLLSDVCIATTAAPTFFPAHYFELFYPYNQAFHVVDGGVGANNPTMVAISNIARHVLCKNDKFGKDLDYSKLIVISVGTGTANEMTLAAREGKYYKAKDCAKWGAIGWIFNDWGRRKPIVDMLMGASDFLVDYYVAMLLQIQNCDRYLRIQALEVKIGNNLLESDVCRVDKISGFYLVDRSFKRTNREELKTYARFLQDERDRRLGRRLSGPPRTTNQSQPAIETCQPIQPENLPQSAAIDTTPPTQTHTDNTPQPAPLVVAD